LGGGAVEREDRLLHLLALHARDLQGLGPTDAIGLHPFGPLLGCGVGE